MSSSPNGKLVFDKSKIKKDAKKRHDIETVDLPDPKEKYSSEKELKNFREEQKSHTGRPRKNKSYGNLRTSKENLDRMKAMEIVLDYSSHNDLLTYMLNKVELSMDKDKISTYQLFMKTYKDEEK